MSVKKGLVVLVETGPIVLYWTCPNCNKDNQEDINRNFDSTEEIECENCSTIITKQGEVRWVVK